MNRVASPPHRPPQADRLIRLLVTLGVVGVVAMLLVARQLTPSPLGFGTHQQLGLPPCGSITFFDIRCPACGMTTAWSLALHGQWSDAWRANAGGLALLLIALAYIPVVCYYLVRGYWSPHGRLSFSLAICLSGAIILALGQWLLRLSN